MSQEYYDLTAAVSNLSTFLHTRLPAVTGSIMTSWAGTSEPGSSIRRKGLWWLDETGKRIKLRNVANGAWLSIGELVAKVDERAGWGSTFTVYLPSFPQSVEIESVRILSTTTTSGSDGSNNYAFALTNATQTEELFSAAPSTQTVVSGVGGGEITANTAYVLTPNQNDVIAAGDVMTFTVTVTGSPTSLTRAAVSVVAYPAL